jgi:hypothetical protein
MSERLTRRRFARLAIAGGVAAGSIGVVTAPFANTIFAKPADPAFIGLKVAPVPSNDSDAPEVDRTEFEPVSGAAASTPRTTALILQSLDLTTGRIQSQRNIGALQSNELISGSAILRDGTVVIAITPASGSANQRASTRLTRSAAGAAAIPVGALKQDQMLADLLVTADNRVMGLVTNRGGAAPATLVSIDLQTGQLTSVSTASLPGYWRISTIAQSPGGHLYATAINRNGDTHLIQGDAGRDALSVVAPLTYGGAVWNNGLQNLVFSNSGDLIAFGALRYETINTLYRVDPVSGEMTRLFDFDVANVAAAPA